MLIAIRLCGVSVVVIVPVANLVSLPYLFLLELLGCTTYAVEQINPIAIVPVKCQWINPPYIGNFEAIVVR
jgi:hypothetical protein